MGKEVCVLIRAADEVVLLGQGQFGLSGGRNWRRIDGGQGVGHEPLGERLDMLVAVEAIGQGALASRVDQAVRVGPTQTHDAPSLRWPTRPSMPNSISQSRCA